MSWYILIKQEGTQCVPYSRISAVKEVCRQCAIYVGLVHKIKGYRYRI